jgi:hypothetical protein
LVENRRRMQIASFGSHTNNPRAQIPLDTPLARLVTSDPAIDVTERDIGLPHIWSRLTLKIAAGPGEKAAIGQIRKAQPPKPTPLNGGHLARLFIVGTCDEIPSRMP